MKLLLRRGQYTTGTFSKTINFTLDVRAEVSDEEHANIKKFRLGGMTLYSRGEIVDPGKGLLGLASRVAFKMKNISVCVADLVDGKRIDCVDIMEMLAVQEQIKEACQNFKAVLEAAAHFDGEEVVEL